MCSEWAASNTAKARAVSSSGPARASSASTPQKEWEGKLYESPRHHQISFVADDLAATVRDLEAKGAGFTSEVVEEVFGLTITLAVPGADDIMIYQPSYTPAFDARTV